jgi:hypothetical protein
MNLVLPAFWASSINCTEELLDEIYIFFFLQQKLHFSMSPALIRLRNLLFVFAFFNLKTGLNIQFHEREKSKARLQGSRTFLDRGGYNFTT